MIADAGDYHLHGNAGPMAAMYKRPACSWIFGFGSACTGRLTPEWRARSWPHAQGATHLILDPLDFLRRLAALVSFPGSHHLRYPG